MRSENNMAEVVSCSVQSGVDTTANDNEAIRWAAKEGYNKIVNILFDAGAKF